MSNYKVFFLFFLAVLMLATNIEIFILRHWIFLVGYWIFALFANGVTAWVFVYENPSPAQNCRPLSKGGPH